MELATDWLKKRALYTPDKVALIDTIQGTSITYAQWNARVNMTARYLREDLDIGMGDRIAILATNCSEYLDVFFACNKLGAILQNLNWRLLPSELMRLMENSAPSVLIYSKEFAEQVKGVKAFGYKIPERYVTLDDAIDASDSLFTEREKHNSDPIEIRNMSNEVPWLICYTGGTTGLPKGVILSQKMIMWNAINTSTTSMITHEDVQIMALPLFHSGGFNVFMAPLVHVGGTTILCRSFDVDQIYALIAEYPVTVFAAVPTIFIEMLRHPKWEATDFSSFKYLGSGGASCPMPVAEKFWNRGLPFCVGYGMTESGPSNFFLPMDQHAKKPGYVGYPLMHVEVKLIDENKQLITEPYISGELLIRGDHCTPGYWANPGATAKSIDVDGWLHTDDAAIFDEDGAYKIVGRLSDLFISGGENIYPGEVESVLFEHPDIMDATVFGIPDEYWGEVGHAVIVALKPLDSDELTEYLREKIAHFKVPKTYSFIDEIPKTAAGKIDRKVVRKQVLEKMRQNGTLIEFQDSMSH